MNKMYIEKNNKNIEIELIANKEELDKILEIIYQNILTIKQSEIGDKGKFYTNIYRISKNLKYKGTNLNELVNLYLLKIDKEKNNKFIDRIIDSICYRELEEIENNKKNKNVTNIIKRLSIKPEKEIKREETIENVKK